MSKTLTNRDDFLADIIICAVEGGTSYWAAVSAYKHSNGPENTYAVLHEYDDDTDEWTGPALRLDPRAVAVALAKVKGNEVELNSKLRSAIIEADKENDACEIDADLADIIAQVALLGEITYG